MNTIKHYKHYQNINYEHRIGIQNLMDSCELLHNKEKLYDIVDDEAGRSMSVLYNKYQDACAFCMMSINYDNIVNVDILYVDRNERNKGYACELLKYAKKYALKENCSQVNLVVNVTNIEARKLYEKNEFLYNKKRLSSMVVVMNQFSHRLNYIIGGMLYELVKLNPLLSVDENINQCLQQKNFSPFYRYLKKDNKDEIIEKVLKSKELHLANELLSEIKENNESLSVIDQILYKANRGYEIPVALKEKYSVLQNLNKEEILFTSNSIKALDSFYQQENFLKNEEMKNINSIKLGNQDDERNISFNDKSSSAENNL